MKPDDRHLLGESPDGTVSTARQQYLLSSIFLTQESAALGKDLMAHANALYGMSALHSQVAWYTNGIFPSATAHGWPQSSAV